MSDETNIKFRKKLKDLRLGNKYTIKVMSEKTGLSQSFYWQIENGLRNLTYENAQKISSVFNLKPDDIFYNKKD